MGRGLLSSLRTNAPREAALDLWQWDPPRAVWFRGWGGIQKLFTGDQVLLAGVPDVTELLGSICDLGDVGQRLLVQVGSPAQLSAC